MPHGRVHRLLPLLTFALLLATTARAAPTERWYGVYLGGKRAGYLKTYEERTRWRGKPADLSASRMRLDLRVLGADSTSERLSRAWSTPAGAPLEVIDEERAGSRVTRVRAVYTDRSVTYEADLAGLRKRGTLRLKPGEKFWTGDPFSGKAGKIEMRVRYKSFNQTTLALEDSDVTLGKRTPSARQEIVAVGGLGVPAFKIPFKIGGTPGTAWVDKRDEMLRFEMGPMRIVHVPRAVALAPLTERVETTDFASYAPDQPIPHARESRSARYRIENLTAPLETVDDDVQTATVTKLGEGRYAALIAVTTGPPGEAPATKIADIPRAAYAAYLKPSLYAPVDAPEMIALARTIIGAETDARVAGEKLSAWVHANLTYDAAHSMGQRHAGEILKARRGICQDYATLLVTLARAAGIPAKHCVGLAYAEGKFYLHAWAQLWVGKWVAFEPTWGRPFADAAHIKLAEGEPTADRKGASRLDPLRIAYLGAGSPASDSPDAPGLQ